MSLIRIQNLKTINRCFCQCKFLNSKLENFNNHSRLYHLITRNYARNTTHLKTPDLVYVPQLLRWIKTKIGFKVLQKTWDPDFSEGAFIYGSTQAICRITEVLSGDDKNDELQKLVTPTLRKKLLTDILLHLSDLQKKVILLKPADIKLLIPIEVHLQQLHNKKHCTVSLRSLAVKWHDLNGVLRLAIIALQTEFIRDYTDKITTNAGWTVRMFDILECGIVGDTRNVKR